MFVNSAAAMKKHTNEKITMVQKTFAVQKIRNAGRGGLVKTLH